ncbi:MAG: glycosyltransferase [Deltaproteobacteria bacterium]|nr:glycosyltransferase [Deltaproteobacteria bacterium]MBZ0219846.1 glycosyltransferase [Deltaproteobacteria bacterium]
MNPVVLGVSFPFAQVRPDTPGGAEQVLLSLDSALVSEGWGSVVIAPEGSRVEGTLIPTPFVKGRIDGQVRSYIHGLYRKAIGFALRHWKIDIVHMHGLDSHEYMPDEGVPLLVTLHLPLKWYPEQALRTGRALTFFNCVSATQMDGAPEWLDIIGTVRNGVPVERLRPSVRRREYALSLGRICPEKGFHIAMKAAKRAGVPFVLAGSVFPYSEHEDYFKEAIAPNIGDKRIWFAGPAGFDRKRRLLAGARCVLIPSLVPETSSLVAMEALAAGAPVIAFPAGALAEVVEHGRTGFLVEGVEGMARAIRRAGSISSDECMRAARRFSSSLMASGYIDLYRKIISIKRNGGRGHGGGA